MTSQICPTVHSLQEYAAGRLSYQEADSIEQHLETCQDCLSRLDQYSGCLDTLANALKSAPAPLPEEVNSRLAQVMASVMRSDQTQERFPEPEGAEFRAAGEYRILEEIGRGGIGRVYRASHPRLDQDVALKMLSPGIRSPQLIARFQAESRALVRMEHPGIARVLDVGTTDDLQPFLVMELIRGVTITNYCHRHCLTLNQRMELFLQVCAAVRHAHQKALIHRDLKPSNVLVAEHDGRPVVRVIDFGIARALDQDSGEGTQEGMLIGTPQYMSPEQASLRSQDVDTRSDVFALGVLLYELLTESTPFRTYNEKSVPVMEQLRRIREEGPVPPATRIAEHPAPGELAGRFRAAGDQLLNQLRSEPTWILLRALEKGPDDRYESVAELADDIQRFLDGRPVLCTRPSPWYRFRKLIQRHRVSASLVVLLCLTLIAGTWGTLQGLIRTARERDEKSAALQLVEKERDEKAAALAAEQSARKRADAATTQTVTALQTLTEETVNRLLSAQVTLTEQDRKFLEQIIRQLEQFSATDKDSKTARMIHAEGLSRVGTLLWRLGDYPAALERQSRAIEVWKTVCTDDVETDNPEYRRGMADSYSNRGITLAALQRFEESEQSHRRAIELHTELSEHYPDRPEYRKNVANCRNSLGVMLKDINRNSETIEQYQQALEILNELVRQFPQEADFLDKHMGVENNLGIELSLAGRHSEALEAYQSVIRTHEKLQSMAPDEPKRRHDLASTYANLGMLYAVQGQPEQAVESLEKSEALCVVLMHDYPAVPAYRRTCLNCLGVLGRVLSQLRRLEEAEEVYLRQVALARQLHREEPQNYQTQLEVARAHGLVAVAGYRLKAFDRALHAVTEATEAWRDIVQRPEADDESRFSLANSLVFLGTVQKSLLNTDGALASFEEAVAMLMARSDSAADAEKTQKLLQAAIRERDTLRTLLQPAAPPASETPVTEERAPE